MDASVIAYCSKAGHGTRIMPPGTITGAQVSICAYSLAAQLISVWSTVHEGQRLHPSHWCL
jgi:hypothetical protein